MPALRSAVIDALGFAAMGSGISSIIWLLRIHEYELLIEIATNEITQLVAALRYFPAFLVLGLLSFAVERWCVAPLVFGLIFSRHSPGPLQACISPVSRLYSPVSRLYSGVYGL